MNSTPTLTLPPDAGHTPAPMRPRACNNPGTTLSWNATKRLVPVPRLIALAAGLVPDPTPAPAPAPVLAPAPAPAPMLVPAPTPGPGLVLVLILVPVLGAATVPAPAAVASMLGPLARESPGVVLLLRSATTSAKEAAASLTCKHSFDHHERPQTGDTLRTTLLCIAPVRLQ